MELPQGPQPRPYGAQGRKPTHDFLSLYSPVQQDPSSSTPPGGFLETHDFLQPLEGDKFEEPPIRRSQPPAPEHVLPGGIGTYSISHISYISQSQSQRVAKSKGVVITAAQSSGSDKNDENSNCSSYTGSGFSLWEESAVNKGKTGKENIAGNTRVIREGGMKTGGVPWMTSMERPSQSSSAHNHPTTTMSSLLSSCPSSALKNPSFVDTLKSVKSSQDYADDEQQEFVIKEEPSSHYKGSSFPSPLQSNIYSPASLPSTLAAESANTTARLWQTGSYTNDCAVAGDKLIDQGVGIESGTISISTIYSQG
ncbi:hypothetical protein L1987_23318 [Smallanthus sonchifolius]|uniref:Uncharacterized protein n=1 Tax=Smallanthus sonchifolius TaxID=185202 RepID=A0ACB9IIT0_9ASTR|nr:hypothetical protein L1987_23318 [Smallanthus sonchifolius]